MMVPRTAPDLTAVARRSLEEATLLGELYGLDRALQRFDVDLACAAFWAVEDLRQAGHAELRRQHAKRRLQLVTSR
ncbi:MAG: hypothetical protein ACYDDW_05305 [Dermatophilaceae bacterium]